MSISDVKFDEIESIETIENYSQQYVYDYSVKDNETFGLSNGLLVHNTLIPSTWRVFQENQMLIREFRVYEN